MIKPAAVHLIAAWMLGLVGYGLVAAGYASLRAETPDDKVMAVIETYSDIAQAGYADAAATAKTLQAKIEALIKAPSETTLAAARRAWRAARVPYQQTEVFRFGNRIVDDWEGKVNAWPLDEGLIDYVSPEVGQQSEDNALYTANVIANPTVRATGVEISAGKITKRLIAETLHEAGGIEANVARGYHAVEFLLWGQDLNGTGPGAGNRPATDFDQRQCTGGHCDRRSQYLRAVSQLLVEDLDWMARQWRPDGAARKALLADGAGAALIAMFKGMGSLSYGELAGERMQLGLMLHDPEEEHDCFSDNTHNSHYYNVIGIQNVYLGRYRRVDGRRVEGPSLSDLVKQGNPKADHDLRAALDQSLASITAIKQRADRGEAYDQMIGEGNSEGNALVQTAIDHLIVQSSMIKRAVKALDLKAIELLGSDSLDRPETVGR